MNFFSEKCRVYTGTTKVFGIYDDGKKIKASEDQPELWDATINNTSGLELTVTQIDKCVIQSFEEPGELRCDAMLTTSKHLYFVELKSGQDGWMEYGKQQVESTINLFLKHHKNDAIKFTKKKVFVCNKKASDSNKKHSPFIVFDNDENISFFKKYGFRIDVQSEVIVAR